MNKDDLECQEDFKTATAIFKKAIKEIVDRQIPPTPQNYSLWYLYSKNSDENLKIALENNFRKPRDYHPDKTKRFYSEYILDVLVPNHSKNSKIRPILERLINEFLQKADSTVESATGYHENLKTALTVFQKHEDEEEIEQTLRALIHHTEDMSEVTRNFQQDLIRTKAELYRVTKELKLTKEESKIDGLTQLNNRKTYDQVYQRWFNDQEKPLSLMLLDLDHFKRVNDEYGHPAGDRVLELTGALLKRMEDDTIFAARYGGEELAVLVRDGLERAVKLANVFKTGIATTTTLDRDSAVKIPKVTVSIGVATRLPNDDPESLMKRADDCLYYAKNNGRNQVSTTSV